MHLSRTFIWRLTAAVLVAATMSFVLLAWSNSANSAATPQATTELRFESLGTFGGSYTGVVVSGTHALATRGRVIDVFDVSNPRAPALVSSSEPLTASMRVLAIGRGRAYLTAHRQPGDSTTRYEVLRVVDVTDIEKPEPGGEIGLPLGSLTYVAALDQLLLVTNGDGPIAAFDASDANDPVFVGRWDLGGAVSGIALHADGLIASVADDRGEGRLVVLDTSNTRAPTVVGQVYIGRGGGPLVSTGRYAFAEVSARHSDGTLEGMTAAVDLVIPAAPAVVTELGLVGVTSFAPGSQRLWALQFTPGARLQHSLWSIDATLLTDPVMVSRTVYGPGSLAAVGDSVIRSAGPVGLQTLAHAESGAGESIVEKHLVATIGDPQGVVADGNVAYVSDHDNELWAVSLSQPDAPSALGRASFDLPEHASSSGLVGGPLSLHDGYAYVLRTAYPDQAGGIHVFDVRDAQNIEQVAVWDPIVEHERDPATDIADCRLCGAYPPLADNNRLWVPGDPALAELDITDPTAPVYKRKWDWPPPNVENMQCYYGGVDVSGNRAWLAGASRGLFALDVSTSKPISMSDRTNLYLRTFDVEHHRGHLLAADASGLRVLDTNDLTSIRLADTGAAKSVQMRRDTAFVSTASGVVAVDVQFPVMPVVRGSYGSESGYRPYRVPQLAFVGDLMVLLDNDLRGLELVRMTEGDALPQPTVGPTLTPYGTGQPTTPSPESSPTPSATETSATPTPTSDRHTATATATSPSPSPDPGTPSAPGTTLYLPFAIASGH